MPTQTTAAGSTKLLIFGLPRNATTQDVRGLLGQCKRQLRQIGDQLQIDMLDVPGQNDSTFAVVHLWYDPIMAWDISSQINTRRLQGRPLQALVPSMAW
jgi:hypothetical protein